MLRHRWIFGLAVLPGILAASIFSGRPAAAATAPYTVTAFDADYYLTRDGNHNSHLRVQEHITINFPQTGSTTGFVRYIPRIQSHHRTHIQIESLTDTSGKTIEYSLDRTRDMNVISVGDPDSSVHGPRDYVLTYSLSNIVSSTSNLDEFSTAITGYKWPAAVQQATARLHLTSDLAGLSKPQHFACTTGTANTATSTCTISPITPASNDNIVTYTATRQLEPGESFNIAARFDPITFSDNEFSAAMVAQQIMYQIIIYVGPFVVLLLLILWFLRTSQLRYNSEIIIDAPVDWVADLFERPENYKHWQPGFVWYEQLSGRLDQPKNRAKLIYHIHNRRIELVRTTTERNFPNEFVYSYKTRGLKNITAHYFLATDKKRTKWVVAEKYDLSGFMKIVALISPQSFRKDTKQMLAAFKAYAEKGTSVAGIS